MKVISHNSFFLIANYQFLASKVFLQIKSVKWNFESVFWSHMTSKTKEAMEKPVTIVSSIFLLYNKRFLCNFYWVISQYVLTRN